MMPTVTLEVAFTTDPAATPTWTDISAYLREFLVHRGRTGELDRFAAGRATIILANEDRRFDPTYTASPYYPNVVPMRRVRIRATYNAVTYDVFNGYADGWEQTYQHPQEALCTLSVTDAFKVLANIELPASVYEVEVRTDNPTHWWRLGDPAGSTQASDAVGTAHLMREVNTGAGGTAPTFGASGLTVRDPDTAVTFTGGAALRPTIPIFPPGTAMTVEFILADNNPGTTRVVATDPNSIFYVQILSTGALRWVVGGTTVTTSSTPFNDTSPHHVALTRSAAGALKIYVDGADVTGAGGTDTTGLSSVLAGLGDYNSNVAAFTVDEFAIYDTVLSTTRIAAHSSARATAWSGETSGARVGRILDAAGWSAADRNLDTGLSVLQGADLGGSALAALQKVEETEQGRLYVTAAGLVRFIARDKLLQAPYTTSQATFGDDGAELEYEDLTYRYDDQLIYNEARVSRAQGTVQVARDMTSQTRYMRRVKVADGLLHQADTTSIDLAHWIVAHYKDPLLRVTDLTLNPAAGNETTHFPQVLGRELAERVTVRRRPQNLGAAIDQATAIEGVEHRVTATRWDTKWNLSPAETQQYWILGVAGASELGQTTRLGF